MMVVINMRVEMWFDFNKDSYETLINLEQAIGLFYHAKKVDVLFRSLPLVDSNYVFHEAFQYGRKKGLGFEYLKSIFEIYFSNQNLLGSCHKLALTYGIEYKDLEHNLMDHKTHKIVCNQIEHATLQKIDMTPTITFSHGFRLQDLSTIEEIKLMLIKMYEKDSGIKYCIEEDCER